MDPFIAAGAQTAGNIGGQLVANIGNKKAQRRAFEYNLYMWNKMNEYNSPKAQMARYREAGLNPNLMYGQGTSGNATQLPKYMAPEYKFQMPDALAMLNQYQNTKVAEKQVENISADTGQKLIENSIKGLERDIKEIERNQEMADDIARNQTVYNPFREKKTARHVYWNDQLENYNKAKTKILEQSIEQTQNFLKYQNIDKVSGIAGQFLRAVAPFMQYLTPKK